MLGLGINKMILEIGKFLMSNFINIFLKFLKYYCVLDIIHNINVWFIMYVFLVLLLVIFFFSFG